MVKKYFKSITALILSVAMMIDMLPITVFAKEEPMILEYVIPAEENNKAFSIATISNSVKEGGRYIVTITRNSSDEEASVFLKTIDMSAKYGEDYIVNDENYKTDTFKTNGTILEQSADIKEQEKRKADLDQKLDDAENMANKVKEENEKDKENLKNEETETKAEEENKPDEEKSKSERTETTNDDIKKHEVDVKADKEALENKVAENDDGDNLGNEENNKFFEDENKEENEYSDLSTAENALAAINAVVQSADIVNSKETTEIEETKEADEIKETEQAEETEETTDSLKGKSELAILKEKQTGKSTRATKETDFVPIENMFIQDITNSMGNMLEVSSSTELVFKKGENLKQVVIEILDDDISEGMEILDIMLSDASEGWNVGTSVNCTLTIEDDETVEHSVVGFSETSYVSENGTVEITVSRSGAEYSLVTAMVKTVQDGKAVEGENYAKVDALVELAPYVNEKKFNIPVKADKECNFSIELCDIKGGVAGDNQKAVVTIVPPEKYMAVSDDTDVSLADDEDKESFSINLSGKDYIVQYVKGNSEGEIIDDSFNPPITVGKYIFPMDSKNGGNFNYGWFEGYSTSDRKSEYRAPGGEYAGPQGSTFLYWYNWKTWNKGSSSCFAVPITDTLLNTRAYQYISANWEQPRTAYGGQYVEMNLYKNGSYFKNSVVGATGNFSRTMSNPIKFLNKNSLPEARDINVKFMAQDRESNKTPKIELYVSGLAAMYRKFKIELEQPSVLTYLDANGNKVSKPPAVVEAAEGHNIRYFGQDYQLKVKETTSGEPIKGKIKEYEITVGSDPKKQTKFTYKPKGNNIQNIAFNDDFIKTIDEKTQQISEEGYGFYTNLRIKPVFEYINVSVDVLKSDYGKFDSASLTPGKHTFHVGDEFLVKGTPNDANYRYVGYNEKAYKNSSDTQPLVSGDMDNTEDVISLNYERYSLKPNFSMKENYIGIKLTNEAKKYLTVLNTLDSKSVSAGIKEDIQNGIVDYALLTDTENNIKNVSPTTGKAYHIQVVSNNASYIPSYKVSSSNDNAVGSCFDYIAMPLAKDNIITVGVCHREPENAKIFALDGISTIPSSTIRSTANQISKQGVSEINLSAGGEECQVYNLTANKNMKLINRKTSVSDNSGKFSIKGVKGYDDDVITVYMTNGDVDQVCYVKLSSKGIEIEDIQYTEIIDGKDTPVTKKGYTINIGEKDMPIRTPLAPYVSSITYDVDQIRDLVIDTRNNEIPILSTKIYVTANLNLNGRDVKTVVFTKVSKNGAKEEKRVDKLYDGQLSFKVEYKMDAEFESGDMLYVKLIDNEDRVITTNYIDEITGEQKQTTTKEERAYFNVPTGLSFYVPTIEIEPQTFDFENTASVSIPILDNIASSQKSGSLSFNKIEHKMANGQNNPYTLQFYFAPGYSTMLQQTAATTLNNIKKGASTSKDQLLITPEAEEDQLSANMMDLFDETGSGAGQASFEKKYKSMGFKKSLSNISKATPFDVHALLMLSFDFFYDNETNQYVMTTGQYLVGAYFTVAKCMYWTVYGVPMYLKVSGTLGLDFSGNALYDDDVISQYDFSASSNITNLINSDNYITMTLGGSAAVGVGLCGVISARGIVNMNVVTKIKLTSEKDDVLNGFLFKLGGGFGVDLLIFSFDYAPSILTYGYGVYKGLSDGIVSLSNENSGELRKLNEGTWDMSDFGKNITLSSDDLKPVSMTNLLTNAMERTRPKITTLSDGRKFIVFTAKGADRDSENGSCLMYSICDTNGVWAEPQRVDSDNTIDTLPSIVPYGDKIAVLWSDANKNFSSNDMAKDILSSFDISCRVFDTVTNTFGDEVAITSDNFMDTAASVYIDSETNEICVYYVKRDIKNAENDEQLVDVAATYNTLACKKYDLKENKWNSDETYLDILHDRITDPLIVDFSAIKNVYDGKQYVWMTYTVDEDEDMTTAFDREVYVILENVTDGKGYYPIAISKNNVSDINPKLINYKGSSYVSWVEDGTNLKMTNLTEIFNHMKDDECFDKYMADTGKGWYIKTAGELGMSAEEYSGSIYEGLANNNIPAIEKNFSMDEYIDRTIGAYQIYNDNDKNLYAFWVEGGSINEGDGNSNNESAELFGAIFEEIDENGFNESKNNDENTVKYSGWSNAVQITDFDSVIDEFNLTFDKAGNMSMVSNMFKQNIDENGKLNFSPNNLVEIDFTRECALSLNGEIEFDKIPVPGEDVNIGFTISNNGLTSSEGYDVIIKQVKNGKEEQIYSESVSERLITGYSHVYDVLWKVPDNISDTSIVVEIKEKNIDDPVIYKKDVEKKAYIEISDEKVEFDDNGKLYYDAVITNSGNISSGKVVLNAFENEISDKSNNDKIRENKKLYGTHTVGNIDAGKSVDVHYRLSEFNSAEKLTKYGYADILNSCLIDGNEVKSTVVRVIADDVVDIVINNGVDKIDLRKGETAVIKANVIPSNIADKELFYSSNNHNVASVTSSGNIIPVGNGSTKVSVLHSSSGFKKTINVNVSGFDVENANEDEEKKGSSGGSPKKTSDDKKYKETEKTKEKTTETEEKTDNTPKDSSTKNRTEDDKLSDWNNPFTDVSENAWYYNSVKYVCENNIFSGMTDMLFGPDVKTTRGMLVTTLGKMEGINPDDYANAPYSDVNSDMYYAPYIAWASQNNIVSGFGNNIFKPDDNVTREQLAKIIRNYFSYKGKDINVKEDYISFEDKELISDWAKEDVVYCYENNIISGDDKGMFNPKNGASRAELATVIMKIALS